MSVGDMSQAILSVYGFSKNSTTQPTMLDTTNELPTFNPNFWDFQYIDNCLDDVIRIDVDAVSTTPPKGLIITLGFKLP